MVRPVDASEAHACDEAAQQMGRLGNDRQLSEHTNKQTMLTEMLTGVHISCVGAVGAYAKPMSVANMVTSSKASRGWNAAQPQTHKRERGGERERERGKTDICVAVDSMGGIHTLFGVFFDLVEDLGQVLGVDLQEGGRKGPHQT